MIHATLLDDIQGRGRAVRYYELSEPAKFRGLGMRTTRIMVSVAPAGGGDIEVAILPVTRDGHAISHRQAVIHTDEDTPALAGLWDHAVLAKAGITIERS